MNVLSDGDLQLFYNLRWVTELRADVRSVEYSEESQRQCALLNNTALQESWVDGQVWGISCQLDVYVCNLILSLPQAGVSLVYAQFTIYVPQRDTAD